MGFPIGITTLVLNVPLVLLGFRFVGRAFLGKTVISMLWCTFFQDVAFADQPGYGGDPLLAALFRGYHMGRRIWRFCICGVRPAAAPIF